MYIVTVDTTTTTTTLTIYNFDSFTEMVESMKKYSQENPGTKFLLYDDPKARTLGYAEGDRRWVVGLEEYKNTASSMPNVLKELVRTSAGRSTIAEQCSS